MKECILPLKFRICRSVSIEDENSNRKPFSRKNTLFNYINPDTLCLLAINENKYFHSAVIALVILIHHLHDDNFIKINQSL